MWWLALVVLAGCTQVFGLDDTRAVDPDRDRDHDGVEDGDDNCPDIANNDQRDAAKTTSATSATAALPAHRARTP
jgi:hypothetical protein